MLHRLWHTLGTQETLTTERLSSEPGSKKLQTWPSQTKGQQTAALRHNDPRRERDGGQEPGEVTAPASKAPTPDTAGNSFHHRLQPWRAPGIIFPFRISKAAAGLFWLGNLILRWVYFSTLENSQCRTGSEPAPNLLSPPSVFPLRLRTAHSGHPAPELGPKWVPRPSLRTRRAGTGGRRRPDPGVRGKAAATRKR